TINIHDHLPIFNITQHDKHPNFLGLLTFAVPPLHIYRQLRGAYRVSRIGAAWRTAALLLFATWALALFLLLLVALGVLG
ncbi:MAG: hypothetical protein ACJ8DZ_01815, partial [Allosphingosinicella sp.]